MSSGVNIYSGVSNDAELKIVDNSVVIDAPISYVNNTLIQPKSGYASVVGGDTLAVHFPDISFVWSCFLSGPGVATWTNDSIQMNTQQTGPAMGFVSGFTVLNEGFYRIAAGASAATPLAFFNIQLNGVNSFFSNSSGTDPVLPSEWVGVEVITHLTANTSVKVQGSGAATFAVQGSYLTIERMNAQSNIQVMQLGTTSTFANM